eukprot:1825744-Amphidinium_carterae.2
MTEANKSSYGGQGNVMAVMPQRTQERVDWVWVDRLRKHIEPKSNSDITMRRKKRPREDSGAQ